MAKVTLCDKCGDRIPEDEVVYIKRYKFQIGQDVAKDRRPELELCPMCATELDKMIDDYNPER